MMGSVSSSDPITPSQKRTPIIRAVLIGGLLGVLLSVLIADVGQRLTFDSWQRVSPREITTDNVAVVLIDDEGMDELGAWPWSRYVMARLVEEIAKGNPKAIGIDIYFTQPDPLAPEEFASLYLEEELSAQSREEILALPRMDEVFAQVLAQSPTVLARTGFKDGVLEPSDMAFGQRVDGTAPEGVSSPDKLLASIPALDSVAMSHAMVDGILDDDSLTRGVPLAVNVGGVQAPGFALELARIAADETELEWDGNAMRLGDSLIPTDDRGVMAFRMGDVPPAADIPAWEILTGETSPDIFAGKVVLLGVGATGTYDIVATPQHSEIFGVFVQAQAVDAIIEDEWLSRPLSMIVLEALLAAVLIGLIFAGGMVLRNWPFWTAGALAVSLPFISWALFTQANLLFDPVRPLTIAICAAIALAITRFAIARKERSRLAHELVEERIAASEQKGELEAARRIQMSMVPGPKALSRLDVRAEIAGVLEPAKSVGGDFFDAVKINDDLLLFLVADVTGKGVPAALFMALSKTLSKSNLARAGDGLETAIAALNFDLMDEADEEMGLTMLAGTIDCSTGACQMINAGHENPMIARADGSVETFAMRGGPPLCVIDFPYTAETIDLTTGDTLVIITDGATEAANSSKELFGTAGVTDALNSQRVATAEERASHLAKTVRDFEGDNDPTDDLTIFALRYLGAGS